MRKQRTFRIRPSLDARLQAAAVQAGRSVSEEIEYRIERSCWEDYVALDTYTRISQAERIDAGD